MKISLPLVLAVFTLHSQASLYAEEKARLTALEKTIIGTWKLVSTEEKLRNGQTRPYPDLGEKGQGYLMYTADGHMCVALMNPGRPRWTHDEDHPTDAEKTSAASGYTSYCGTYKVDEKNHLIFHYPEISFFPNFIGTEQKRPYRFEGGRMIFSDSVAEGEVERWTIVWEKSNPSAVGRAGDAAHALDQKSTEEEIMQTIARRLDAVSRNDTQTWASMVADSMLSPLEGATSSKQAWINDHQHWPREVRYWYGPLEDVKVRIHGDTAVVSYHAKQFNEIGGQTTFVHRWQIETHIRKDGHWLLAGLADSPIPLEPKAVKLSSGIYDAYAGDYEWAPTLVSKIRNENGRLVEELRDDKTELLPESETTFFIKGDNSSRIVFVKDTSGRVTHYIYREFGGTDRVVKKIR